MNPESIPLTAWQQAVIVVLFVLAFLVLIGLLLAWMDKQMRRWQIFIGEQNDKWQAFIRDERVISSSARKEDCEKLDSLTTALERVVNLIADFRADFNEHVVGEDAKFSMMLDAKQKRELAERMESQAKPKKGQ